MAWPTIVIEGKIFSGLTPSAIQRVNHAVPNVLSFPGSVFNTVRGQLHQMQDLNLSETTFDDENMRVLNQMTDLKTLILNKTRISDIGMAAVKEMTVLNNLFVGITDVTAQGLALVP